MRTTLNISFPSDLYLMIQDRVQTGGFVSISEYIRTLVREDFAKSGGRSRRRPKSRILHRAHDLMAEYDAGYPER